MNTITLIYCIGSAIVVAAYITVVICKHISKKNNTSNNTIQQ